MNAPGSGLTWESLRATIDGADAEAAQQAVLEGTEAERSALAKPLTAYATELSRRVDPDSAVRSWQEAHRLLPPLAVAAVGCLPSAAAAAAVLSRRRWYEAWSALPADRVVAVARVRQVPWLADLADRLAAKIRVTTRVEDWAPVAGLVVAGGGAPPTADGFVRLWVASLHEANWWSRTRQDPPMAPVLERMRSGPFLHAYLHRLSEVEGLGLVLAGGRPDVIEALVVLAAAGEVDRRVLLDGCVLRLRLGDRPGALRGFSRLLNGLDPTTDELAERVLDLADLVADAPSPVASLAQRHLRTLQAAGQLELDALLGTAAAVLDRTEKGVVREHLGLLARAVQTEPARAAEVLRAVAAAFGHAPYDVRARALAIVEKHAGALGALDRAELADAAVHLDPDLRPGLDLTPTTPPVCTELTLTRWGTRVDDPDHQTVVVDAALGAGEGTPTWHATYAAALARRDGRWEIAELLPAAPRDGDD